MHVPERDLVVGSPKRVSPDPDGGGVAQSLKRNFHDLLHLGGLGAEGGARAQETNERGHQGTGVGHVKGRERAENGEQGRRGADFLMGFSKGGLPGGLIGMKDAAGEGELTSMPDVWGTQGENRDKILAGREEGDEDGAPAKGWLGLVTQRGLHWTIIPVHAPRVSESTRHHRLMRPARPGLKIDGLRLFQHPPQVLLETHGLRLHRGQNAPTSRR